MSINAVKGVEIGAGFDAVEWGGEQNADQIRLDEEGNPVFLSNHAGGILAGIVITSYSIHYTKLYEAIRRAVFWQAFQQGKIFVCALGSSRLVLF